MNIGIDGNEANIEKRVGVNEYAFQILWGLKKLQENGENKHNLIVYLKSEPLSDMPKESANFKYKIISSEGNWILTKLTPVLIRNKERLDLFFTPSHYVPFFAPIPKICSIMDVGYLESSEHFTKKVFWQLKWWSAISIFVSKRIIAISNSTRDHIVRHYPFSKNKIEVTYLGFDKDKYNIRVSESDVRRVKKTYSIVDDYILYFGTLKPSKNIVRLVEAFGLLKDQKVELVIAGKKGWLFESVYNEVKKLGLSNKIIFTDYVKDSDKSALIRGAKVFVLPSLWEGFGLDALNAMACGVPVVASNVGSLPEVVGEAGILVNPQRVEDIAKGIKTVLTLSKNDYNSMVEKGMQQAGKFSWEKCSRETLRILENAL